MPSTDPTDPRRLFDLAAHGEKADCMAAIQFLELQIRILARKVEGRLTFTGRSAGNCASSGRLWGTVWTTSSRW